MRSFIYINYINTTNIMINIIIPIHVSEQNNTIGECIRTVINNCSSFNNISNIIIVSSKKISINFVSNINILLINNKDVTTRARAMNIGFKSNKSKYCMFLHCDTLLPKSFDTLVISKLSNCNFCFFKLKFDMTNLALRLVEKSVNNVRNFPYGDQCFCLNSKYHSDIGMFKDISFLEDYVYIKEQIPISYRQNVIDAYIITSSRRFFSKKGLGYSSVYKNVKNNKDLINRYNSGECIDNLSKIYYKNGLNGTYYT